MKPGKNIITIFIALLPLQMLAGWILNGRYIDREGNTIQKIYYFENNKVKVERYNLIYSVNLNTGSILLVDPENLVYVNTSLSAYTAKLKEIKLNRLAELLTLIPDEEKKEYELIYRSYIENQLILSAPVKDSLSIKIIQDSVKLLGYAAAKYNFSSNGIKKEEFFFTREVDLSKEVDMKTFLQYVYLIEPDDKTVNYMISELYLNTIKNGLVLRKFIYEDGYRTEWQINKIDRKDIPDYEFGKPELCKELTLEKWFARKYKEDEKYYDDYE